MGHDLLSRTYGTYMFTYDILHGYIYIHTLYIDTIDMCTYSHVHRHKHVHAYIHASTLYVSHVIVHRGFGDEWSNVIIA